MQTLLCVFPMTTGEELAVRQAHDDLPIEALERGLGIDQLIAFIGSGYYALELTIAEGDVQQNIHRFLAAPEIQSLFAAIRPSVQNLPNPDDGTADMPMATAMFLWQRPELDDSIAL